MRTICTDSEQLYVYEDYDAFLHAVSQPPLRGGLSECWNNSNGFADSKWSGTATFQDAMVLARKGWPEGLARMEAMRGKLLQLQGQIRVTPEPVFAECGDEVDVGRFLSGEPEHMIEFPIVELPASGRIVKIMVNIWASSGISNDSLFRRGAAAVMLADALESSGLRCEIWTTCASSTGGKKNDIQTCVKRSGDPLELDRLAFILAHPASLRRLHFHHYEIQERSLKLFGPFYGTAGDTTHNRTEDTIYIGSLCWGKYGSDADCMAYIQEQMANYVAPVDA